MACCQQRSPLYLILTNLLFFICGCILLTFGMMATQHKIKDAILCPANILKMVTILGIILIFISLIGILGVYYQERKMIHILYATLVIVAFVYQISIAVIVYVESAHITDWLSNTWNTSPRYYKLYAQTKFNCCGFSNPLDHSIATSTCFPDHIVNSAQPCYEPLKQFIQTQLGTMCKVLFASLSIELLALCNCITLFCVFNTSVRKNMWEVGPEESSSKFVHSNQGYNHSSDTLVNPSNTIHKPNQHQRQF